MFPHIRFVTVVFLALSLVISTACKPPPDPEPGPEQPKELPQPKTEGRLPE